MTKDELAKKLVSNMSSYESLETTTLDLFDKMLPSLNINQNEEFVNRFRVFIVNLAGKHKEAYESMQADVYAQTFSEDELKGLLDFYESKAGKALVAKRGELERTLNAESAKYTDSVIMMEIQEGIIKIMEDTYGSLAYKHNSSKKEDYLN